MVVAFALGMFWKRATGAGAITAIVAGVVCSYGLPPLYEASLGKAGFFADTFGPTLNFMHAVFLSAIISAVLHVVVRSQDAAGRGEGQVHVDGAGRARSAGAGSRDEGDWRFDRVVCRVGFADDERCAVAVDRGVGRGRLDVGGVSPVRISLDEGKRGRGVDESVEEDRFWAGLLCATAVFMLFYFV